jgi:hypothetical protein
MRCQFNGDNFDDRDASLDGQVIFMNDIFLIFRIDVAE